MKGIRSFKSIKGIKGFLERNFFIVLLVLLSLIPLLSLLHAGLPHGHDTQDHVARIANFYRNLEEGVAIPRWAGNLDWGYGHPILMFLYPFSSYSTSLIHLFGFSFVDSVKLFFGLAFIASGLTMYLWLKEFLSKESAFLGAMLYIFAPYRFIDLYVRGAIGEHAAFIFPPLVLYFLFKLAKNLDSGSSINSESEHVEDLPRNDMVRYWYLSGGALSLAGLILAHNAISLMFLPIIILYAAYLIWQSKRKKLLIADCLLLIAFGFSLSAFFWLPAFVEGKYTLRDIVTSGGEIFERFVPPNQFLYGPWSYGGTGQFSVQIGIVHWLFFLFSLPLVLLFKKKNKHWTMLVVSLVAFLFTLFLMTEFSQLLWHKLTILQKFQFPWRFLSLIVFFSALVGAIVMNDLVIKLSGYKILKFGHYNFRLYHVITILFVILILLANKGYWQPREYLYKSESFYTGIYDSTTDTGESAPIWSVRFMEKRPKGHMEVIGGKAIISEGRRTSTEHRYLIDVKENAIMMENTLYFPGWKILVDGVSVPIEFQDRRHHGIMTFALDKGKHDVVVKLEETKLRLLADWISLGSLVILVGWGLVRKGVGGRL